MDDRCGSFVPLCTSKLNKLRSFLNVCSRYDIYCCGRLQSRTLTLDGHLPYAIPVHTIISCYILQFKIFCSMLRVELNSISTKLVWSQYTRLVNVDSNMNSEACGGDQGQLRQGANGRSVQLRHVALGYSTWICSSLAILNAWASNPPGRLAQIDPSCVDVP